MNRAQHILSARSLSSELRLAASRFDRIDLTRLDAMSMWEAMQPDKELKKRFTRLLEDLYFNGIRSQFFGDFDANKLILPVAKEIADRLDVLANDIEVQLGKSHLRARPTPIRSESAYDGSKSQ